MANCLKMTKVSAILTLKEHNWSCRRISRELGIHLDTVRKYAGSSGKDSKQVNAPIGSEGSMPITNASSGAEPDISDYQIADDNNTKGSTSQCQPFGKLIEGKLDKGLTRQRIYQDLCDDYGFSGSYYSVRRFVKKLGKDSPVPFRRMECKPGEQAQVDFGTGAPVIDGNEKKEGKEDEKD